MDEQWEDGTTVAESGEKRAMVDEPTVEDQARPLPPLQLVQGQLVQGPGTATGAADPRSLAKLQVIAGSDQGRVFDLRPGKELSVGRAVDNDVVLTDIAVSRRHLELSWDGDAWVLRDRGSGNGTLINERIEDGRCHLRDGDRIEIGNTVFRFDHPPSAQAAAPTMTGWGQEDEEAATVAGKAQGPSPGRAPSAPPLPADPQRPRPNSVTAAAERRQPPPPGTPQRAKRPSQAPDAALGARPGTVRGMPVVGPGRTSPASTPPPELATPSPVPQFLGGAPMPGPPSGPITAPQVAATFGIGARPATTTALVEPRLYAPAPYPFIVTPDANRRKHLLIGGAVAAFIAFVGIGAMVAGGGEPTPNAAKTVSNDADVAPAPVPSPAPVPDDPPPAPGEPAPVAVDPQPQPAPGEPAPVAVDPQPQPPEPVPVATAPQPPTVALDPTPVPAPVVVAKKPPPPVPAPVVVAKKSPPPAPVIKPKTTPPKASARTNDDFLAVEKKPSAPVKGLAGAEKKADSLYRSKDWKSASSLLRDAATSATDGDARRLKSLANDYDSIGTNLSTATALAKAKATDALGALKKALAADRRAGGAHQQVIREKMAQVAPSAAAAYMAKQNYPMAKLAADDAVNVGAGSNSTVANVRSSLERKAGEFYASAQKLMTSKPEEAKTLLRNIIKIVPADSSWYSKAYKLLNQRKPAAADEDE